MNDRDELRYAGRRAAFLRALRDGDAIAAARSGARLRLFDAALGPAEFARAREARRILGRAIVNARITRPPEAAPRHEPAIGAARGSGQRRALAALAVLALILLALIPLLGPHDGGGGTPQPAAVQQQRSALLTVSRGRTVALPVEIVVVADESPTPAPTEQPSASPESTAAASASAPPGNSGATGSTGAGGSGGGAGGGRGGGQGPGTGPGTSTPTPGPTVAIGPLPPGFARLVIIVLDAQTRRPIPDVCVVIGTANCEPGQPHTDPNGRWAADVAASSFVTYWDVSLIKSGYTTLTRRLSLRAGSGSTTYSLSMRRG